MLRFSPPASLKPRRLILRAASLIFVPALVFTLAVLPASRLCAQDETPAADAAGDTPAATGDAPAADTPNKTEPEPGTSNRSESPSGGASSGDAAPSAERIGQAAALISEAFTVGNRAGAGEGDHARIAAARGAAAILPRLEGSQRDQLTSRWITLMQSKSVPRALRLSSYASFFDVASRADADFARHIAMSLPDDAARAGAFIDISEAEERMDYRAASADAQRAQQAARRESSLVQRARALTFVAHRMANLGPEWREAAVVEASSQVRLIAEPRERDYLLAEVVGAAAKFDLGLARRISTSITNENLKNLATARINISEISQTTLGVSNSDRIEALAKAAARYDVRAIPILIQLPPQAEVLTSLSDALPPIYPTARPNIDANLLGRMWNYAAAAEPSVQRDALQSRLARLMVLQDLWRGRDWGKQLAWKGGRIQVGAFLKAVAAARRSAVKAEPLQDLAAQNINRAIAQARTLPAASRVEATLLIAGQILA